MNARVNRYEMYQDLIDINIPNDLEVKQESEVAYDRRYMYPSCFGRFNPNEAIQNAFACNISIQYTKNLGLNNNSSFLFGNNCFAPFSNNSWLSSNLSKISNQCISRSSIPQEISLNKFVPAREEKLCNDSTEESKHEELLFKDKIDVSLSISPEVEENHQESNDDQNPAEAQDLLESNEISENVSRTRIDRWTKEDDILMFQVASALVEQDGISIDQIANISGKIPKTFRKLMNKIKQESNWRGTLVELKTRIRKIIHTQSFTERDIRKLKRLLKQQLNGNVTLEFIQEQFPGKTLSQILNFRREFLGF